MVEQIEIGTGCIVFNAKNQILFGKRIYNPEGWSAPGGHVEIGETIYDCAIREVKEETNLEIENIEIREVGENIFLDKNLHSVTIFVFCRVKEGSEIKNMEPNKCSGWEWFDLDNLPKDDFAFNYDAILKNDMKAIHKYIRGS